ncbi:MAG: threonylcarbamoyl-AMP synthase [Paramuribaculum sp.]|nr:threonylcarbamoyl-AMP synthase [Paramuribaculum sp.]
MIENKIQESDIQSAIECLRSGGVILYPTDTVWGLGCDATNSSAVKRIFDIKQRANAKSMISLVADINMLCRYVDNPPEVALQLAELAVTPTTIVYDHPLGLAPELLAPDGSAGIRITSEEFSRELCRRLRRPVVSTSANISGEPTPRFFNEISQDIISAADYTTLYRRDDCSEHQASTVIKISDDGTFAILRK